MRRLAAYYLAVMKMGIMEQFQYPFANYIYLIGMVTEPVIYLTVWSKVAESQGGGINGYTSVKFAAYFIVWTLVRNMNLAYTEGWQGRISFGKLNIELLKPIHPLHFDVAYFAGWKLMVIIQWLPVAVILMRLFKTNLHPTWLQVFVFSISIWGAHILRSLMISLLGSISFWTTREDAFIDLVFALELIVSGRLVPLTLMPGWVQMLSSCLPFQWTFYYPINVLVGSLSMRDLLSGIMIQFAWIVLGILAVKTVWRLGITRYSAVGG
jgi:ABC-2 type transport system permease protein